MSTVGTQKCVRRRKGDRARVVSAPNWDACSVWCFIVMTSLKNERVRQRQGPRCPRCFCIKKAVEDALEPLNNDAYTVV